MNDFEQHLRRQFKSEADELLFQNLQFDSRLQQQVRGSLDLAPTRFSFSKWFRKRRMKWVYGTAITALIVGFVVVFAHGFQDRPLDQIPATPFAATVGPTAGISSLTTWQPANTEEAKAAFGEGLLIPAYVPDRLPLSGISASGARKGETAKVVFSYLFGERSFVVIEEKETPLPPVQDYQEVDIGGFQGYVKSGETDTELHWLANGVHYSIFGTIKDTEAIQVARSMK